MAIWGTKGLRTYTSFSFSASFCIYRNRQHHHHLPNLYATWCAQLDYPSAGLDRQVFTAAHKTRVSLSSVNDRVGGPCQPGAWTRARSTLQFTPSGQGVGAGGEKMRQMTGEMKLSIKRQLKQKKTGREMQLDRLDNRDDGFISHTHPPHPPPLPPVQVPSSS